MTTLQYVRNTTRRFHTFVANRLTEIHESTTPEQWHFVPGNLNPADEGSRGMDIQSFQKHEKEWPKEQIGELPADDKEIRVERNTMSTSESNVEQIFLRYSSWPRLLRVMAWVLRFVKRLKKVKSDHQISKAITLAELQEAGQEISRLAQRQVLQEDYSALVQGRQVKAQSKLANLSPTLVDGVIRVGGRIHRAPIAFDAAHPIILPREHPVSILIVRHYHRALGHAGREHVLSVIRQKYWILGARSLVKNVSRQCVTCRKRSANPMKQRMGDLPKERLVPYQPPFTYTGQDFFGPFHVKRGRSTMKVYGCIFVCFNSRAVHIEDVSSLETDAFIQALRRFIAVRGCPKEIWSDNGTNFTGAEKELRRSVKELNAETIEKEFHSKEVEWYSCPLPKWQFQPPTASNMSGVWERLIRSVRKAMKGVLGDPNATIGCETLRTVFAEVTAILNDRPLCPCSDDPNDAEALTPNHFLLQRKNIVVPPGVFGKGDIYGCRQWRQAQFLADCIWTRWLREYIPMLQRRQKWILDRRNLAVNDLVLIADSSLPRSRWLLGRVTRTFPG